VPAQRVAFARRSSPAPNKCGPNGGCALVVGEEADCREPIADKWAVLLPPERHSGRSVNTPCWWLSARAAVADLSAAPEPPASGC
ncbi:unnamed protein product, partial [Lampetra planeri]